MKIDAGLTSKAVIHLSGYSQDNGWTVRGRIVNASQDYALATSLFSGSGEDWTLKIPKATTTAYAAGTYSLQLVAIDPSDAEEYSVHSEPVAIVAAGKADLRSENEIILEQLRTVIRTKSTKDHESISIEGRSITRLPWEDILKAEKTYARRVANERRISAGGSPIKTLQVGFSS